MSNRVSLSPRDLSLLRLLSWTPATTALLLRASSTFDGEPFSDERRLRERLQTLSEAGVFRYWSTAHAGGGLKNYYKLTPVGFEVLYGTEAPQPTRAFFSEVSPSLFEHTFRLAEVIVEIARKKSRRVVYAATHESYVTADDPLHMPVFLDHRGDWQSLVDLHPMASYRKTPVRLARPVESTLGVC